MEKREIKFKYTFGIDGNEQTYFTEVLTIGQIENGHMHIILKDVFDQTQNNGYSVLYKRQYTGLKDKNGKEIYEGDIVKIEWKNIELDHGKYGDLTEIRLVEYKSAAFWLNDIPLYLHVDEFNDIPWCEIIGNIYENPELLKDGN